MKKIILIAYLIMFTSYYSFSHEYNIGNILIDHPKIIKNKSNVKGYMIITNKSESDLYLIGGKSYFSEELILHKEGGGSLSTMQKISQIKIPAESTISLKDLNLHLMFLNYSNKIKWFEPHKANLYFSNNMNFEVEFDLD